MRPEAGEAPREREARTGRSGPGADRPLASVIIPLRNAAATLGIQLKALVDQVGAPPFEVIVADNGSTDGSRATADRFRGALRLRIIDASSYRGSAHARNAGARAAQSENLLFCDADDRVGPRWVAAMYEALTHQRLVAGPVIYTNLRSIRLDPPPLPTVLPSKPRHYLDQVPFAPSNNLALHADLMRELEGFDCELLHAQEADLTIRAQLAGNPLAWAQDAVVFNARRDSLRSAARQFFWYGYYDAMLYRKLHGHGLSQRSAWTLLRPYLILAATPHRLLTRRRRWSWIVNASQRVGRIVGSVRARTLCL